MDMIIFICVAMVTVINGHDEGHLPHSGAKGTEHGRDADDPRYHYSNSEVPHLPYLTGFFGTHSTIRRLTVTEQTATFIGEAKHGLWRIQKNGMIREYRKTGVIGIPPDTNPNAENLDENILDIIRNNYDYKEHYHHPEDLVADGEEDGIKGSLNYIDLTIYHPKYGGMYDDHAPIDLPYFYCTLSDPGHLNGKAVWDYVAAQPQANKPGPLAKRAGFDVKEAHLNYIRVNFFQDAGIWANVGTGSPETDEKVKNLKEAAARAQTLNYLRLDLSRMDYEVYLMEKLFFGSPYIFVAMILDYKENGVSQWSYLRRDGPYWEQLKNRVDVSTLTTNPPNFYPPVVVEEDLQTGMVGKQRVYTLPVYGIMHPDRPKFGLTGGACPAKGEDWDWYPWGTGGSGFPDTYEEVTPLCDGVTIDIKFWANLWSETWNDKTLHLGNAGFPQQLTTEYVLDANVYGRFTDPYLSNTTNPHLMDLTTDGETVGPDDPKGEPVVVRLNHRRQGTYMSYNTFPGFKVNSEPEDPCYDQCFKEKDIDEGEALPEGVEYELDQECYSQCQGETSESATSENNDNDDNKGDADNNSDGNTEKEEDDDGYSRFETIVLVLLAASLLLNFIIILAVCFSRSSQTPQDQGHSNKAFTNNF